jgi:hypothetical protein
MLSAMFAVAVLPLRAVTVIMPLLTTKWPEIVLPFMPLKLTLICLPIPFRYFASDERNTFVCLQRKRRGGIRPIITRLPNDKEPRQNWDLPRLKLRMLRGCPKEARTQANCEPGVP